MLFSIIKIFQLIIIIILTNQTPLNLNLSVIQNLTKYEKKIVVCDKIGQLRARKERGKFRDKILDLFGEVIYSNKRIIYDRLILNCIKKINLTFTEQLLSDLINDRKIDVKQSEIENMLDLYNIYRTKTINFQKIKRNITKILNRLYHPDKFEKSNKKIETINNVKEVIFMNYIFYYSNFDLIIFAFILIIIFIFIILCCLNKKIFIKIKEKTI